MRWRSISWLAAHWPGHHWLFLLRVNAILHSLLGRHRLLSDLARTWCSFLNWSTSRSLLHWLRLFLCLSLVKVLMLMHRANSVHRLTWMSRFDSNLAWACSAIQNLDRAISETRKDRFIGIRYALVQSEFWLLLHAAERVWISYYHRMVVGQHLRSHRQVLTKHLAGSWRRLFFNWRLFRTSWTILMAWGRERRTLADCGRASVQGTNVAVGLRRLHCMPGAADLLGGGARSLSWCGRLLCAAVQLRAGGWLRSVCDWHLALWGRLDGWGFALFCQLVVAGGVTSTAELLLVSLLLSLAGVVLLILLLHWRFFRSLGYRGDRAWWWSLFCDQRIWLLHHWLVLSETHVRWQNTRVELLLGHVHLVLRRHSDRWFSSFWLLNVLAA